MSDRKEQITGLIWLPFHMFLLPRLLGLLNLSGLISEPMALFVVYLCGALYMLVTMFRLLRRGFDRVCDGPFSILIQVAGSYLAIESLNILIGMALLAVAGEINPNNAEMIYVAGEGYGLTAASAVFLAPIVEECIFRAGLFGILREKNRILAYILNAAMFSLYHVFSYAMESPIYLIYALQYIPASILLCRCYEKTESIWTPIFLHMLINGISMQLIGSM